MTEAPEAPQLVQFTMAAPRPHRSFSSIRQYIDCGEQFRLERVEKVVSRPYVANPGGGAFHRLTEDMEFDPALDVPAALERWPAYFDEAVAESEERSGVARDDFRKAGRVTQNTPNKEDLTYWRDELGPKIIGLYRQWMLSRELVIATDLPPDENGRTVGIEYAVDFTIADVRMIGYLDRVMYDPLRNVWIPDVKSGSRVPTSLQLPIYKVGLEQRGVPAHYGAYYMARKGLLTDAKPLTGWSEERIARMVQSADYMERIGFYAPNPGDHCNFCGVSDHCQFKP